MLANPYKQKLPSDESKWVCIYPLYLNSRKTIVQGRRISKDKAVDSPTSQEIFDILQNAGLKVKLEKSKMHPLDPSRDTNSQGRVRVQLRNDDGSIYNAKFPTRRSLMLYACEMIPKLKSRQYGGNQSHPGTSGKSGKQQKKKR
uniref:Signal recognition particle 19 kDa protein n=1 Tax=Syphacia muris TaxID=451379 RepID=A0A0N5ABD4_9BILA